MFILPLCGPAIVILHGMPHTLYNYDLGNAQILQNGDEIIYFSRQPDIYFLSLYLRKKL